MDYDNLKETFQRASWSQASQDILMEPYTYISAHPGKEIRPRFIEAFNLWLKVDEADLEVIRRVVTMLHNASLLMDDVEDNSELRRGLPVAHTIYGVPQTINSANYVYFLAMQEMLKLASIERKGDKRDAGSSATELMAMVTEELLNLHRGQGLDLFWRDSLTCPSEEQYIEMVLGKTGGLFRLSVKLMMARSDSSQDFVPLVNLISVYFQIRDDYMNLQSSEYEDNKGFCEDLTEGKFSFPVVHGVRADRSNRQILNVLQKKTTSVSLKRHAVEYLDKHTHSFEYTRSVLRKLLGQIEEELARLGGNNLLEGILKALKLPEGP